MWFVKKNDFYSIKYKGWSIIAHLFLCIVLFQVSRIGFYLNNTAILGEISFQDLLKYCFYGLRFDIAAIAMTVGWLFIVWMLPLPWKFTKIWSLLFTILFSIVLCFEISDWKYFGYTHQRSGADTLAMLSRPSDFLQLLPNFLSQYWMLFVLVALFIYTIYLVSRKIFSVKLNTINTSPISLIKYITFSLLASLFTVGLTILGIRGGTQLVPIASRNAIAYAPNAHIPVVLNTTFNVLTSLQNDIVTPLNYVDDTTLRNNISAIKYPSGDSSFKKKNVIIIILESFSKEFTGISGRRSYTPFLDSLMQYSTVFTNAYANSNTSAKGIPAILAGIPAWRDEAFMTSTFANNKINSFASLLKKEGYSSTFYHGGSNGTMSFDVFTKNAGYDSYFGRNEYNNEKDFDGNWGIWDEPFLQRVAQDISTKQPPFHAVIFNLNSHHPYQIPKQYKNIFNEQGLPIYSAIRYSDYALKRFFHVASKTEWFENSLFIFVADHASPMASNDFYTNGIGKFQIPIFIYDPEVLKQEIVPNLVQQIDLLPTILYGKLNYKHTMYALGQNVFKNNSYVISKSGDATVMICDSLQLNLVQDSLIGAYIFPTDSLNRYNIIDDKHSKQQIHKHFIQYKSAIQCYVNDMIANKMIP
jgi:phosphoglycerol transferase MdoB-like AlkP superfamily enzyme